MQEKRTVDASGVSGGVHAEDAAGSRTSGPRWFSCLLFDSRADRWGLSTSRRSPSIRSQRSSHSCTRIQSLLCTACGKSMRHHHLMAYNRRLLSKVEIYTHYTIHFIYKYLPINFQFYSERLKRTNLESYGQRVPDRRTETLQQQLLSASHDNTLFPIQKWSNLILFFNEIEIKITTL